MTDARVLTIEELMSAEAPFELVPLGDGTTIRMAPFDAETSVIAADMNKENRADSTYRLIAFTIQQPDGSRVVPESIPAVIASLKRRPAHVVNRLLDAAMRLNEVTAKNASSEAVPGSSPIA